jgi:pimeloyl-ACP methyl ester carboxylesterase
MSRGAWAGRCGWVLAARTGKGLVSGNAAITTPTLLLGGGRSPDYLRYALRELDRILPNGTLVLSPQLDHNAPDVNAPETVAGLVRAFLTPADATF